MRTVPSIASMKPEQILRKESFMVPLPSDHPGFRPVSGKGFDVYTLGDIQFGKKTQADFLREYYPSSHAINSLLYYPNSLFRDKDTGKIRAKVHTRTAVAYQQMIKTKRKTALIGNNVAMKLVRARTKQAGEYLLAKYREGWEESNVEIAIDRFLDSDYITADGAVYVYQANGRVGWRVFSYLEGDTLYPHRHPLTGEVALLGRRYMQEDDAGNEVEYLDVIDDRNYMTYRLDRSDKNGGWVVEMVPVPHGFDSCPVAYHRSRTGPVWSASQSIIDEYEIGISQFCEYNMIYGLGILFTSGAEFEVMTDNDGTPLHIDSPNADAKAQFLNPASDGADSAFAKQLEILDKNIMRCSFVQHAPEIKSGADMSGLTVKMLNSDPYYKALEDSQEYQLFLDRVSTLFRIAYGRVSGMESEFSDFRVKTYLEPFYFMSETEIVNALVQLTAAGVLSKESATEIAYNSGYGTADEWGRVLKEAQAELTANQAAQASQQTATTTNPVTASRENG